MTTDAAGPNGAMEFPDGFVWGAASSAYQIEGAADADGRAPSTWDTFSHTPGKVPRRRQRGCRLRLLPPLRRGSRHDGEPRPRSVPLLRLVVAGSARRARGRQPAGARLLPPLVEGLRERGIIAALTLYHWDLPQTLEDTGGWANRDTAERFADYAQIVAEAITDPGVMWITLNEPQVVANQGYRTGVHAPGIRDDALAAATTHHLMLAHGLALERLRATLPGARAGNHARHPPDPRRRRRGGGGGAHHRRRAEPDLDRPRAPRPLSRARARSPASAGRADPRRGHGADLGADRLRRGQLLLAALRQAR